MRARDGVIVSDPVQVDVPGGARVSNPREEQLLAAGYLPYTEAEPPPPSLAALRSAALERYRGEAGECLRRSLPTPWDVLRAVATAEYQAWADELCALVAAELARIEAAVAAAESAEALDAIVADWPEVEG